MKSIKPFPRAVEVKLSLNLKLESAEDEEYIFGEKGEDEEIEGSELAASPEKQILSYEFLSDILDIINENSEHEVLNINGYSKDALAQALQIQMLQDPKNQNPRF